MHISSIIIKLLEIDSIKKNSQVLWIERFKMFEEKKIIIFGAHPDDIENAMGATVNQLKKLYIFFIYIFLDASSYYFRL